MVNQEAILSIKFKHDQTTVSQPPIQLQQRPFSEEAASITVSQQRSGHVSHLMVAVGFGTRPLQSRDTNLLLQAQGTEAGGSYCLNSSEGLHGKFYKNYMKNAFYNSDMRHVFLLR